MWDLLGFKNSPYNAEPLRVKAEDVELLVGRSAEALEFQTTLEAATNGVTVISGPPGVGKTSFLNVQQYLLETGGGICGPRLLAARHLCPIQPEDDTRGVLQRAATTLFQSISSYCEENGKAVPSETRKIGKWIMAGGNTGFDIGLSIAGFGGNIGRVVELPSASGVSFEGMQEVLACMVSEVVAKLGFTGAVICLDNVENLSDQKLKDALISMRDTAFAVSNIWWVIIGQSGLSSLISELDPRVSERLIGPGLELRPISLEELNTAIKLRVNRFHSGKGGAAPLPEKIHEHLYAASNGEMRFVFKYSNNICIAFVSRIRKLILEKDGKIDSGSLNAAIGDLMTKGIINEDMANELLVLIVRRDIDGLSLKPKDKEVLKKIGSKGSARSKEHREFGLSSGQDFSSNYLVRFFGMKLLVKEQEGTGTKYSLRGLADLANEFGLL